MMTLTEENYLKALHRLSEKEEAITVKRIALLLDI
ncbi:MAG: metal-dependent transcriptional regulator, partial [Pedobacter sp.]|nr:metal-dependent transcriptional regulator [Chitinophagaceae bacterium]